MKPKLRKWLIGVSSVALLLASPAVAQINGGGTGGPGGPSGSPYGVFTPVTGGIAYNGGCFLVPSTVAGGCEGAGTVNFAQLYLAGVAVNNAVVTYLSHPVGTAGGLIAYNGDAGKPSHIDLTNATNLPSGNFTNPMTVPLQVPNGSVAAPSLQLGINNLGIYNSAVGVGVSVGGNQVANFAANLATLSTPIALPVSTATNPAVTFGASNFGIYGTTAGGQSLAFSVNGVATAYTNALGWVNQFGFAQKVAASSCLSGTIAPASWAQANIMINQYSATVGVACTVNLPASPIGGQMVTVKDLTGQAPNHTVTITPNAGLIDGAASYSFSTAWGGWTGIFVGPNWYTVSRFIGDPLPVANGGTGASTAAAARTNLGAAASGANTDITSLSLGAGSAATPSIVFSGSGTTGLFGGGALQIATNGLQNSYFNANGFASLFGLSFKNTPTTCASGSISPANYQTFTLGVSAYQSSGGCAINLPASPGAGQFYGIFDGPGTASVHPITITPASGLIDGQATATINANFGSWLGIFVSPNWKTLATRGNSINTVTFTVTGTYTPSPGLSYAEVYAVGAGGGGGGGAQTASGTAASGGSAGGAGNINYMTFTAAEIGVSRGVTIGAGGTGGAASTTAGTAGAVGTAGTSSGLGNLLSAQGGGAGAGGQISGNSGGGGGGGTITPGAVGTSAAGGAGGQMGGAGGFGAAAANSFNSFAPSGGAGSSSSTTGTAGGNTYNASTGGGAGGGITAANAVFAGGAGGAIARNVVSIAGGLGGTTVTINGGNGNASTWMAAQMIGTGGGGGASSIAGPAGNGGNGLNGGGGGGGGTVQNGGVAGTGGNGGSGFVMVVEHF